MSKSPIFKISNCHILKQIFIDVLSSTYEIRSCIKEKKRDEGQEHATSI